MIDFNKPSKRKERLEARKVLYIDILFIILPFVLLFIVQAAKETYSEIWQNTDWSIAASILSSQALVRYYSGLMKYQGGKKVLNANLWGVLIICFIFVCLVNYVILQIIKDSIVLQLFQIILFIASIRISMVFGSVGQVLYDLKRKNY